MTATSPPPTVDPSGPMLARRVGLVMLIIYGVGDMVGSGIYGTIGAAAQSMGNAVWLAFVGSMVAAGLTGLSYAALASRYPRAAGAAFITHHAYRFGFLAYVVGLAVAASGLTSMATNSNVFAGTLAAFVEPVPMLGGVSPWMVVLAFIALMTFFNFWGITHSMWANVVCTAVEVGGLVFIIVVGIRYWGSVDYLHTPPPEVLAGGAAMGQTFGGSGASGTSGASGGGLDLWLIASGAVLTFFAFVGFEDMLNVAEEVRHPRKNMPWGIVLALGITAFLYIMVAITVVSVVHYGDLGDATLGAPLAQVTDRAAPWLPGWVFEAITLFAASNSVLINYIMASRMVYGMSRQGLLPPVLGRVHAKRHTPHVAIGVLMVIVVVLSLSSGVAQLGAATSLLLLLVFCVVNMALVVLMLRKGEPKGGFEVPVIVPILGSLACAGLIAARLSRMMADPDGWHAPAIAGGLVAFIALLYAIARPRPVSSDALLKAEDAM